VVKLPPEASLEVRTRAAQEPGQHSGDIGQRGCPILRSQYAAR
jgi:hypothetical protein